MTALSRMWRATGPCLLAMGMALNAGCVADQPGVAGTSAHLVEGVPGHRIRARGSFSCDFALALGDAPLSQVPAVIERDRMYMASHPGIVHKHLPISIDFATGTVYSGGRYLFDTREHAAAYRHFVTETFVLDGVQFLDRPLFVDPFCTDWDVIGAHDLTPIETTHYVMRTERFTVPAENQRGFLQRRWHGILREAADRGLAGVWLLYNREERLAQIVYHANRVGPADPTQPDVPSLEALASQPPLGAELAELDGWTRVFDRTHWVFTIWYPYEPGDTGIPSLWPNSPPFPAPFCGDAVCEVSRGEDGSSCSDDCPVDCGDAVCDPGEDTHNCPGDCRIPESPQPSGGDLQQRCHAH